MSTKTSLLIALVMLVTLGSTTFWLRQARRFSVATPTQKLSEFPKLVDGWQGSETELQEGIAKVLGAVDFSTIGFDKGGEAHVIVHLATWTDSDSILDACPHHPTICYPANGWAVQARRIMQVEMDRIGTVPIEVMVMRRGNEQVIVASNYRIGGNVYTDEKSARATHLQFWGKPVWPAVTKLMIQVGVTDIESAKPTIDKFVRAFDGWYQP